MWGQLDSTNALLRARWYFPQYATAQWLKLSKDCMNEGLEVEIIFLPIDGAEVFTQIY